MAVGPGRYDDIAQEIIERLQADGVVLIVMGGNRGAGGMSCKGREANQKWIPDLLRSAADQAEVDNMSFGIIPRRGK